MRIPVKMTYLHNGKSHEFLIDLFESADRDRLIKTATWAAIRQVPLSLEPVKQAAFNQALTV